VRITGLVTLACVAVAGCSPSSNPSLVTPAGLAHRRELDPEPRETGTKRLPTQQCAEGAATPTFLSRAIEIGHRRELKAASRKANTRGIPTEQTVRDGLAAVIEADFKLSELTNPARQVMPKPTGQDDDAVRELVVRDLIKAVGGNGIHFVAFDEESDPPDAFLARFSDLPSEVRKGSRAKLVEEQTIEDPIYFDRVTSQYGFRLDVTNLRRLNNGKITIEGSYFFKVLRARGLRYEFGRVGNAWRMLQRKTIWVS